MSQPSTSAPGSAAEAAPELAHRHILGAHPAVAGVLEAPHPRRARVAP